jgi:hypothetical protein
LQALVPLHELAPEHFTLCALAPVASAPAAKIDAAVAIRVFLLNVLSSG